MYLLTLKDRRDDGAYAVLNRYGEKVLFMFEEEDDAERYAMMLNDDEDADLNVIEIEDALAIKTCKGLDILMLPWINEENKLQTLEMMDTTSADVIMGHLELNGFVATRGHTMEPVSYTHLRAHETN